MAVRQIYDQWGGVVRTIHFDDAASPWHTSAWQDCERVLDFNKALINEGHNGFTLSRDMRHVAKVPSVIYEDWQKEFCRRENLRFFGNRDRARWQKFLKSKLNDRDHKFLRTVEGQL